MAATWISFRIAHRGNYDERYTNLMDTLKSLGGRYWDDTTSFVVVDTELSVQSVMDRIRGDVDSVYDLVLVRRMDNKDALILGIVEDDDIFELMPYLKYA